MVLLPPDHPVGLVFVDEARDEHYFGVGCLKLRDPHPALTRFAELRSQFGFQGKLRWADVGAYAAPGKELVNQALFALAQDASVSFNCVLADLTKIGGLSSFGSQTKAYIRLAIDGLVACADNPSELVAVVADQFDTSLGIEVEAKIVREANRQKRRLVVVAMQRVRSEGTDGLQLADLLLGAVAYIFRHRAVSEADTGKAEIAMALMTEGYGLSAYHDSEGGRSIPGRLKVDLIPRHRPKRKRGGRRPRGT